MEATILFGKNGDSGEMPMGNSPCDSGFGVDLAESWNARRDCRSMGRTVRTRGTPVFFGSRNLLRNRSIQAKLMASMVVAMLAGAAVVSGWFVFGSADGASIALCSGCFLIALPFAVLLRRMCRGWIAGPIDDLCRFARKVATEESFSIRAEGGAGDGFESLASSINQMLDTVEVRDARQRRRQDELEGFLSQRTAELREVNRRFLDSMVEAQETISARSQSLANVSREIRTPMQAILGMTHLAMDTDLSNEQEELLVAVRQSAESLLSMVDGVVDITKIEMGSTTLAPVNFDLHCLVQDVGRRGADSARVKGLRFGLNVAESVPRVVFGDAERLRQVLTNLLSSAVKFSEKGEIRLEVAQPRNSSDGTGEIEVEFAVADAAVGIPAELRERALDGLDQADGSMVWGYDAAALDSAVASQLVEKMSGSVRFECEADRGATVFVRVLFGKRRDDGAPLPQIGYQDPKDDVEITCRKEPVLGKGGSVERVAVDFQLLLQYTGGDEEIVREAGLIFLSESPRLLEALLAHFDANEISELERMAHSLKGLALSIGAIETQEICCRLEAAASEERLGDARAFLDQVNPALERAWETIRRYLELGEAEDTY